MFSMLSVVFCGLLACHVVMAMDPVCANVTYTKSGKVNLKQVLTDCVDNIEGSLVPPSYFVTTGATIVNTSVAVNTLMEVDDITARVTLDIYLRMYWHDSRLNLPSELWDNMNEAIRREGLEIGGYGLDIWMPDVQIMEAVDRSTVAELVRLFENGTIFWSRHMLLTLTEPQMDLHKYPQDTQTFYLTLQSFAYSNDFVELQPINDKFISFNSNPSLDKLYVNLNRLWVYDSSDSIAKHVKSSIFFDQQRTFSTVSLAFTFDRQSFGIVFRLAIPMVIFMIIVGYSFWVSWDKKITIAVTMLLVIASMYGSIGRIIPMVGYFTTFDIYITYAFALLSFTILVHIVVYLLDSYKKKHPILGFGSNLIDFTGRIGTVPLAISIIFYCFYDSINQKYVWAPLIVMTIIPFVYGCSTYFKNIEEAFWKSLDKAKEINSQHKKAVLQRQMTMATTARSQRSSYSISSLAWWNKLICCNRADAPVGITSVPSIESIQQSSFRSLQTTALPRKPLPVFDANMSLEERYTQSIQQIAKELSKASKGSSIPSHVSDEPDEFPTFLSHMEGKFVDWVIIYIEPYLRPSYLPIPESRTAPATTSASCLNCFPWIQSLFNINRNINNTNIADGNQLHGDVINDRVNSQGTFELEEQKKQNYINGNQNSFEKPNDSRMQTNHVVTDAGVMSNSSPYSG